jgi:hypothetical protein
LCKEGSDEMEVNDVGREEKCIEEGKELICSASVEGKITGGGKVYSLFHYKHFIQEF